MTKTVQGKEFEIEVDRRLPGTIEQAWDAVTEGTSGWLWPVEYEPHVGGVGPFDSTILVWDPPHRLVSRSEGENGWYNQLENVLEVGADGGVMLRYVHSGVFTDDWEAQYDGASQHTDFYLSTLAEYIQYFPGLRAKYVGMHEGSAESATPQGFSTFVAALGVPSGAVVGDRVTLHIPGLPAADTEIDYLTEHFLGLRGSDTLYRFFGRNAWDAPVGTSLHLFAPDVDPAAVEKAWQQWIDTIAW